jgi:hypothetical protein
MFEFILNVVSFYQNFTRPTPYFFYIFLIYEVKLENPINKFVILYHKLQYDVWLKRFASAYFFQLCFYAISYLYNHTGI